MRTWQFVENQVTVCCIELSAGGSATSLHILTKQESLQFFLLCLWHCQKFCAVAQPRDQRASLIWKRRLGGGRRTREAVVNVTLCPLLWETRKPLHARKPFFLLVFTDRKEVKCITHCNTQPDWTRLKLRCRLPQVGKKEGGPHLLQHKAAWSIQGEQRTWLSDCPNTALPQTSCLWSWNSAVKNWGGEKERPTTGGRDCRDKSSGDPSIPWLLTGHEANAQPTAVV